jgi:hypothetical protein
MLRARWRIFRRYRISVIVIPGRAVARGSNPSFVIPGCAAWRRPGIHDPQSWLWIPGSRAARPGVTKVVFTRRAKHLAPHALICPPCPAPSEKIFWFSETQISTIFTPSCPTGGAARDRHGRGAGCGGRKERFKTNALSCGRRRRVVLTPRRWCQVLEKQASQG